MYGGGLTLSSCPRLRGVSGPRYGGGDDVKGDGWSHRCRYISRSNTGALDALGILCTASLVGRGPKTLPQLSQGGSWLGGGGGHSWSGPSQLGGGPCWGASRSRACRRLVAWPVVNGGGEGGAGQDYVSSELALPCRTVGADVAPRDAGVTASGAPGGRLNDGGRRTGGPIENNVAWRPFRYGADRSEHHAPAWRYALCATLWGLCIVCVLCCAVQCVLCFVPASAMHCVPCTTALCVQHSAHRGLCTGLVVHLGAACRAMRAVGCCALCTARC